MTIKQEHGPDGTKDVIIDPFEHRAQPMVLVDPQGNWIDQSSPLLVANYNLELAKGNIPGHSQGNVFGRNLDLDPATPSLVWDYGPTLAQEVYLTADTELFMSSTSASDTNVGVLIQGMTDDYVLKNEVHLHTEGQTQHSVGNWFRIFNMMNVSGDAAAGDMYFAEADTMSGGEPTTPAKVHAYMEQGTGRTHKAQFTVPVDHTLYFTRMRHSVRRGEDAVFKYRLRVLGWPDFIEMTEFPTYQNSPFLPLDPPSPVQEKSDFDFTASTATNNTEATFNLAYILVDNTI